LNRIGLVRLFLSSSHSRGYARSEQLHWHFKSSIKWAPRNGARRITASCCLVNSEQLAEHAREHEYQIRENNGTLYAQTMVPSWRNHSCHSVFGRQSTSHRSGLKPLQLLLSLLFAASHPHWFMRRWIAFQPNNSFAQVGISMSHRLLLYLEESLSKRA
jgi:hypothetical protein